MTKSPLGWRCPKCGATFSPLMYGECWACADWTLTLKGQNWCLTWGRARV